jgi:hypothetical protein
VSAIVDIGTAAATVLGANAVFAEWEFHAGFVADADEIAERNQNIAAVIFESYAPLRKPYEESGYGEFSFSVEIHIFDRADADSNDGPIADALRAVFADNGTILYAVLSDSGSNVLGGGLECQIDGLAFARDADMAVSKRTRRTATFTLTVTCWHKQPPA